MLSNLTNALLSAIIIKKPIISKSLILLKGENYGTD